MLLQMWEHTPNCRHSFLSKHKQRLCEITCLTQTGRHPNGAAVRRSRTSTCAMSYLLEACFARAEGVGAIGDAVGLISITALRPVASAVGQFGV